MKVTKKETALQLIELTCYFQGMISEIARVICDMQNLSTEEREKQTALMSSIAGVSFLLSGVVLTANHYQKPKVEKWLFTFLSPPFAMLFFELFSRPENISLGWFIGLSIVAWSGSCLFTLKGEMPDPLTHNVPQGMAIVPSVIDLPQNEDPVDVSWERYANVAHLTQFSLAIISAMLTLIRREESQETVPLAIEQFPILLIPAYFSAKYGYSLRENQEPVLFWLRLMMFCESATFVYTAFSAWSQLILPSEIVNQYRQMLGAVCTLIAIIIGCFSSERTHFSFSANHARNRAIIYFLRFSLPTFLDQKYQQARELCIDGKAYASRKITRAGEALTMFKNTLPNPRECCASADDLEAGVRLQS